jgi:hypothetical protein
VATRSRQVQWSCPFQVALRSTVIALLGWTYLLGVAHAAAQSPGALNGAPFFDPLDGRVFVVDYGPSGKASLGEDVFSFDDGLFTSMGCQRYGFSAAPYWLRVDGDDVLFRAELVSPEAGVMLMTGTISGDTIEAASVWTRERWYRTVRLESWYTGVRAAPGQPLPEKP